MAIIDNLNLPLDKFSEVLSTHSDSELMAQELVQKGAIHALQVLLSRGCIERNCIEMLESAKRIEVITTAELEKRGMPRIVLATEN